MTDGQMQLGIKAYSLLLVGLLTGSACAHWQAQHLSPDQGFAARTPSAVRLTLNDSSYVWLDRPVLTDSTFEGSARGVPLVVPRSQVATWSVQRPGASPELKTIGAGFGIAALIYLATWKPLGDS
jgi:hypothetical protein